MDEQQRRPELSPSMTGAQLTGWYRRKDELQQLARELGISAGGSKETLTDRISAALDAVPFTEPAAAPRAAATPLATPLTTDTLIPAGQSCTQVLRRWFVEQVGPGFRFDGAMRSFIGGSDGTSTLGDALAQWYATRGNAPESIGKQFEYNRFTRAHYEQHPHSTREQVLAAWAAYRDQPVDQRGRV